MKRYFTLVVLLMVCAVCVMAQRPGRPDPKMWKEIQDYKINFLSQEMDLQKDQEKKFKDLYTEMEGKKRAIFDEIRSIQESLDKKDASEKEYEAATKKLDALHAKDAALNKEYDKKFKSFLSARQIYKMKAGEDKFRQRMQQMRYKGKHHKRGAEDSDKVRPAKR